MSAQPEALRLADELEKDKWHITAVTAHDAASELRRLHAQRVALVEALKVANTFVMHPTIQEAIFIVEGQA